MTRSSPSIRTARMISPTGRAVDIPIENGFVGMVDREHFDEFLRAAPPCDGADRLTGTFPADRARCGRHPCRLARQGHGRGAAQPTKLVIGADGARSVVARAEVPGGDKIPYVIAYHEIIEAPDPRPITTPTAAT
jgi:geranylgeranyl diphosphate/geranylgeranyl-bacteriochlorophyllide a reductase